MQTQPGREADEHPKAGRRLVALMEETHRAKQMEANSEWARRDRSRRRPTAVTVKTVFGSWNAGLEAAGLDRRGPADRPSRQAA
jgi:Homing endonuclease associated repeat